MPILKDLTGLTFGRLTVLRRIHFEGSKKTRWECQCSCGVVVPILSDSLVKGHTKSCGCLQRELVARRMSTHGLSKSRSYQVWIDMMKRCHNPRSPKWKNYGGRGIKVCTRWRTFKTFLADMGERPEGLTLERKNNNKGYSPSNCKWATNSEQQNNRQNTRWITMDGITLSLAEWAVRTGMSRPTIDWRLNAGWPIKEALTTSPGAKRANV